MVELISVAPTSRAVAAPASSRLPSDKQVRAGLFLLLICWAMFAGKDVSWDVLNHQLYLPFSWITGRYRTDLFAASGQSYQNPLGYFPVYGLIQLGLPAWVIGILLSAVHSLVLWPLSRIARLIWPGDDNEDFWWRVLALVLCCVAPIFLIHDGTTSTDPLTGLLVIWAVALSLERGQERVADRRLALTAGALLGLATAVKMSNAVFVVALVLLWLVKWVAGQADVRRVFAFGAALMLVFAMAAGPWMLWLWRDFGNPIYPLYNEIFHSPYAPQQPLVMTRFLPNGTLAALRRIWDLATLTSYVSFEGFLPDIRPLLAVLAGATALVVLAARGGWRRLASRTVWASPGVQLTLSLVLAYWLWVRTSGNARYAIPLFMLVGLALVRATQLAMPRRAAKVLLLTALALQGAYFLVASEYRMGGTTWNSGPYLAYRIPEKLRQQPFLHLAIGTQTHASLAMFLDEHGAFANPIGQMAMPTTGPLGDRFEALLAKWHGRTRLLFNDPYMTSSDKQVILHDSLHDLLYRFGLDVDWADCESIEVLLNQRADAVGSSMVVGAPPSNPRVLSCAALYRPERDAAIDAQRAQADKVFAIMEAACPKLFSPTPLASEYGAGIWQRHYVNTEAHLSVSEQSGVRMSHFRRVEIENYGTIDDVLNHRRPIQCPQIDYQTP